MFYEEKVSHGVLYFRTTPDGMWQIVPHTRLVERLFAAEQALNGMIVKLYEVAGKYNDRSCDFDVCPEVRAARNATRQRDSWEI